MSIRRRLIISTAAVSLVLPLGAGPVPAQPPPPGETAAATAVAWQRIALRTIYTEGLAAPPVGGLYLAFTSLAVHDAAEAAHGRVNRSRAAVATAAHDVLAEYFPGSATALATDLENTLADIPDGALETRGMRIGTRAADRMIDSRADDGRGDATIVYSKPDEPGFWQPAAGTGMAAAWLGFVDPIIQIRKVHLNGPDPLGSAAYATDYNEVLDLGSSEDSDRTPDQTAVALFFTANPPAMYRTALCDLLTAEPMGLRRTTRLFAEIDASVATAFIRAWRLKYDVGFWRPSEAVVEAADDGNAGTEPETGWAPLVPNPAYSDYTSGHASATSPFAEVLRRTLGDDVTLHLTNPTLMLERTYTSLTQLEHDAFHARIWSGLHFRDAMDDGYELGHRTARRVMRAMD